MCILGLDMMSLGFINNYMKRGLRQAAMVMQVLDTMAGQELL